MQKSGGFEDILRKAEQGDARAQSNLGLMYYMGRGVPQDYKHAYAWFNLAATGGYEDAIEFRDETAAALTPQQIVEAQNLSIQFQKKIDNL